MKNLTITSSTKKIEYFPDENIIIKGSGPFRYDRR
jgi:hypothetical protein